MAQLTARNIELDPPRLRLAADAVSEPGGLDPKIPRCTLEVVARSFLKEAGAYGFRLPDLLRFVNILLEAGLENDTDPSTPDRAGSRIPVADARHRRHLPLIGSKVHVRALDREGDAAVVRRWLADGDGRHFLLSRTTAQALDVNQLLESRDNVLGVVTLPSGRPVGLVGFLDHDQTQRKAELRKLIGERDLRGRGLAKEACRLWIDHGIAALSLRKIFLNTLETHIRNIRLNEELGFRVEGVLHREVFFDGRHHDVLRMGLCVS